MRSIQTQTLIFALQTESVWFCCSVIHFLFHLYLQYMTPTVSDNMAVLTISSAHVPGKIAVNMSCFVFTFVFVQVSCASLQGKKADQEGSTGAWAVCLDPNYNLIRRIETRHCRVYSFG